MSLPSRRTSTVSRIVTHDGDREEAAAPVAVTLTLADEIDVSRGDMLVHEEHLPHVARSIEAMVVWMADKPLTTSGSYLLKHGTKLVSAEISEIHERVDVSTLDRHPARALGLNDIGRVTITAARPLIFDPYAKSRSTGAFVLIDRLTNGTSGAGMILGPGANEPGAGDASGGGGGVSLAERSRRLGQRPAAIVLTGADEARREELGRMIERRLWDDGYTAHVLGPREIGAAAVCQGLGLISVLLADGTTELSGLERFIPPAQIFVIDCDGEGASVEAVIHALRSRDIIR